MTRPNLEILHGFHPVYEALRAKRRTMQTLIHRHGRQDHRIKTLQDMAAKQDITIQRVDEQQLTKLVGHSGHQGVCARVTPLMYCDLLDIIEPLSGPGRIPFVLLLDGIQDPQNLGAVVRTAYCAGVDGVVLPKDRSASPLPSVSKASAGALEHMPMARVANLVHAINTLKKNGIWIVGLDGSAPKTLFSCEFNMPLGLIIGGEAKGLRPLVKRHCDYLVSIPHDRDFNSLNASVAAALAMYEAYRQRSHKIGSP